MKPLTVHLSIMIAACLIGGTPASNIEAKELNLQFGVYQTDKPTAMYQKFKPVLDPIQADLARRLDRPVAIRLKIYKTYAEARLALVHGDVDFVRFGPASYVLAKEENPDIELLAMEHKGGKRRFQGLVVVPAESPIRGLDDLKGRSFAFGDENSTIGRYLVQAELVKAGVCADDLDRYEYLGRHDKVAKAVMLGDYDAGSLKENTYKKLNTAGKLRVLLAFENVTKPWIARAQMQDNVLQHLKESLLATKDPKALKVLKSSGFLPATDEDYQFVRDGMKTAKGFLK